MNTTAFKLLGNDPFLPIAVQNQRIQKFLEPILDKNKRMISHLQSFISNPRTRLEMHIYRKALNGSTPSIAKILLTLIQKLFYLSIAKSIKNRPRDVKPKKVSSRLHTLGVIPCAPNALVQEATN